MFVSICTVQGTDGAYAYGSHKNRMLSATLNQGLGSHAASCPNLTWPLGSVGSTSSARATGKQDQEGKTGEESTFQVGYRRGDEMLQLAMLSIGCGEGAVLYRNPDVGLVNIMQ